MTMRNFALTQSQLISRLQFPILVEAQVPKNRSTDDVKRFLFHMVFT